MRKTIMTVGLLAYGAWYGSSAHAQTTNTVEVPLPGIPVLNDPYFPLQWSHMNIGIVPNFEGTGTCGTVGFDLNIPEAWEYMNTQKVEEILVGILDSGLDPGHPDLNPNRLLSGRNFTVDPCDSITTDTYGHGTHVLGAIAATENNNIGIAGVDRTCTVMPLKIDPTRVREDRVHIADAIRYAVDRNVKVFNMSWGWDEVTIDNDIRAAISYGIDHGCVFIGAAGNFNTNLVHFPARVSIAVGAANPCGTIKSGTLPLTCELDSRTNYGSIWGSNYGTGLDIMGPGTMLPAIDIQGAPGLSSLNDCSEGSCYIPGTNGDYVTNAFGTSIAAPYITGIVSQMLAVNPQLEMHEVEYLLKASSDQMTDGYRWADAYAAIYMAANYTPGSHPLADLSVDQVLYERIDPATVQATVTVTNGSAIVASTATQLYVYASRRWIYSKDDIMGSSESLSIPAILPGASHTYTVTFPYDDSYHPSFHKLWLNAIVDPDMLLEETDEANNALAVPVNPEQTFLPELVPVDPAYTVTTTTAAGTTIDLTYKISNEGGADASFPLYSDAAVFWASNDNQLSTDDVFLAAQTTNSSITISSNQTRSFAKTLTLNRAYLIIQADPDNHVVEINETNNNKPIEIVAIPENPSDLHPADVTYSVAVSWLGKTVNMNYQVKNSGTGNGTLYLYQDAVEYWDSYDQTLSGDDVSLGTENLNFVLTLTPGQGLGFSRTKLASRSYLLIKTDPANLNIESNETNNVYAIPLQTTTSVETPEGEGTDPEETPTTKKGNLSGEASGSAEPRLELFPNPAKEQVTVAVALTGNGRILLTDLLGNRLYEQELPAGDNQQLLLDTGHLSAGIYVVELQASGKRVLGKLVIR